MSANLKVVPLVVVSPVRDESQYVENTLKSMLAQTIRPQEWLFVDDGSKDDTAAIIQRYADQHSWIRVVAREDRGFRKLGGGVVQAFNEGMRRLNATDYQYLAKLDGDMSFTPKYLEKMFAQFNADPKLATVSGKVFRPEGDALIEESIIDEHTAGQFKLYRRSAFEQIGGFTETILWDGIDIHRCRMHGWHSKSFHDPEAYLIHHRLMGSSDKNVYKGRWRLGKGLWFMGYHPAYLIASGVFRMREAPKVVGGMIMIGGYFWAGLQKEPRFADPNFRKNLQNWQWQKLKDLVIKPK